MYKRTIIIERAYALKPRVDVESIPDPASLFSENLPTAEPRQLPRDMAAGIVELGIVRHNINRRGRCEDNPEVGGANIRLIC